MTILTDAARDHQPDASESLRFVIELASSSLAQASEAFLSHPRIREVYPEVLYRTHCFARSSVGLMQTALAEARKRAPSDPVAAGMCHYLAEHIVEERGHDEWALQDLEALGLDRREVLARIPPSSVATTVGAQYYWILHHHPLAIFGYIAVLEGAAPTPASVETLIERSGLPRRAFDTLRKHAELDPGHTDGLDQLLNALPLDRSHRDLLRKSALHSVEYLAQAMYEPTTLTSD